MTQTTRQRAVEAAARAIALCGPAADTFTGEDEATKAELAELIEWWRPEATAAFDAIMEVVEGSVRDDTSPVLNAARKAVHDGANALGRCAWDVDAERAIETMISAIREGRG